VLACNDSGTASSIDSTSSETLGAFTTGSVTSSCTVTFALDYSKTVVGASNKARCFVYNTTGTQPSCTATHLAITCSSVGAGQTYNYFCPASSAQSGG
jgi:hypothetical protein